MNQQVFDISDIKIPKEKIKPYLNLLWLVPLVMLVLGSWYTIQPDEVGVIQRFGKLSRTETPGLHFKIPLIEKVTKVAVKRQQKMEFGFRTLQSGIQSQYSTRNFYGESMMLTGDLGIGEIEWIVQYKIQDPVKYLFRVRDIQGTFRNICEASMREVVGDRSINEVLTTGREEIAMAALNMIRELSKQYDTGLAVNLVVLQDVNPPDPVKPSFNEVNQAIQEKENMINQALAQYNKVIPEAKGKALQKIQEAEGYAVRRVNEAQGDVARFRDVLVQYRKAPAITKKRLYFETMQEIIPKIGKIVVIDEKAKSVLPFLNLSQGVVK
ncbi:MAG: FtsH protease activity modulator HflK [Acidobacteria bacterium]|nr:MAG: FtsH protease activity modulator HflK [Acidobacteriota bacterium]RLE22664.1 MAG: FtsH protease activity modulator HflK [Acidobacteriota bacterium]